MPLSDYSKKPSEEEEVYSDDSSRDDGKIAFSEDLEAGEGPSRQSRHVKRLSIHSRKASFSVERVDPELILPTTFRTISHQIDGEEDPKELRVGNRTTKNFADVSWNTESINVILAKLSTDITKGLSTNVVNEHTKRYGANVQSKPPSGLLKKVFMYFFGGFGGLLFVGGILVTLSWKPLGEPPAIANLILGMVLFAVFASQAVFNFWQDFSSSRVMDSIHNMIPLETTALRNGQNVTIPAKDLVPGDIVYITTGTKVPADIRITENSKDLAFDRSVLTGESKPCPASSASDPISSNYLESPCIAMQGTFCVNGVGKGIVVATGDQTIFGEIAKLSSQPKKGLTPLQSEVLRFVLLVTAIIVGLVVLSVILWAAWLRHSYPDWINVPTLIVDLVSIAIAFIPEGLPIALTTCLIITANFMRKNRILCKSLAVVETLGSVSVLCSDKTGTLTKNQMFVTHYTIGESEKEAEKFQESAGLNHLYTVAGLCTESSVESSGTVVGGNATDKAVTKFAESHKSINRHLTNSWIKRGEVSFNSKNKYMIKLFEPSSLSNFSDIGVMPDDNAYLMTVKGAPDMLIQKCSQYMDNETSNVLNMTDSVRKNIQRIQTEWSNEGRRVILLASKLIVKNSAMENILEDGAKSIEVLTDLSSSALTLVGLVGICDPPRDGVPVIVEGLRDAGIRTVMITGDFELTAVAIARMCGIVRDNGDIDTVHNLNPSYHTEVSKKEAIPSLKNEIERSIVISGVDLNDLNDNQWDNLCDYKEIIFARTTPEQKLKIVNEFQARKHIVGMVGDGINDAPSLKQADIGISMIDGCDLAKEASDLVLMDSILSIMEALKLGRLVFENLKKTICYLLPAGTYAELWPVLLNVIFGLPQALSSFNMIVICCLTDCMGAMTLAYEPSEKNLLKKKPRVLSKERLVDFKLLLHAYFTIGTYYAFTSMLMAFVNFQRHGIKFSQLTLSYGSFSDLPGYTEASYMSSSIYFVNLVIMQFFNLLSVRTRYLSIFQQSPFKNKYIFMVIPIALGVTFIINYIPAIQTSLGTAQVPVEYYFIAIGFGLVVITYDELRKYYVRTHPNSLLARFAW